MPHATLRFPSCTVTTARSTADRAAPDAAPRRQRRARAACATLALLCAAFAAPALAQPSGAQAQGIERQMTPEQFKAAGLDKLSAAELANLNAWLNRTLVTETTKAANDAAAAATKKVKDDNRGFFNFGSTDPITSAITGEFRGFGNGRQYPLANGQVWRQVDDASLAGVRVSSPEVVITPSLIGNAWYMAIKGYNTRAKVMREK